MFIIKLATNRDIPYIVNCGKMSLPIYYSDKHLKDFLNNKNIKIFILINKESKELIGFLIVKINSIKQIHILSLAINPNYRQKGLGTYFFNFIKTKYNNSVITLNVQITNFTAINFYFKQYFKIRNFIADYYSNLPIQGAYQMTFINNNYKNSS